MALVPKVSPPILGQMSRIRDTWLVRDPRRLLVGLALILLAGAAQAAEFRGRVVGVTDGDTLKVLHDGRAEVVRLHGIDAPEHGQPFGQRAKQAAAQLAMGQSLPLVVTATWWSGVEPCTILDSIVVDKADATYTVTIREGSSPQEIACIAIAEQHTTEFEIPDVPAGTWTIRDSGGTAPPVEVTVG